MRRFVLWLIFPRHTLGEVFIAFVAAFLGALFSSYWPNILSRGIVAVVMLAGLVYVGKFLFSASRAKPDELTRKFLQGAGMVLILAFMVSYFGWFKTEGIDYHLTDVNKTITIIYGLFISLRAMVFLVATILVTFGNKLRIYKAVRLGLLYFTNIPDVEFARVNKILTIIAVMVTIGYYQHTHSTPEAFIYGALALDILSIPQNIISMFLSRNKNKSFKKLVV